MFPNDRWHNLAFQDGFESSSLIIWYITLRIYFRGLASEINHRGVDTPVSGNDSRPPGFDPHEKTSTCAACANSHLHTSHFRLIWRRRGRRTRLFLSGCRIMTSNFYLRRRAFIFEVWCHMLDSVGSRAGTWWAISRLTVMQCGAR